MKGRYMKKKLIAFAALLLACVCLLCACNQDDIPKGYVLASDPDRDGFELFVPKGWSYQNTSGVVTAYLSSINTANLTVAYLDTDFDSIDAYWADAEMGLKEDFPDYALAEGYPTEVIVADRYANVYEYTGSNAGLRYRFRQYLVMTEEKNPSRGLCAITYTASDEEGKITGKVDFEEALSQVEGIVSNFRFTTAKQAPEEDLSVADDPKAPEGMKRANRFEHLGMDIYVPQDWKVTLSDGFVGAEAPDGASVGIQTIDLTGAVTNNGATLTERMEHYGIPLQNENGFTLIDYWNLLKAEYADYYEDFTVIDEPAAFKSESGEEQTAPAVAGQSTYYSFTFAGTKYGVRYEVTQYVFRKTKDSRNQFRTMIYTTKEGAHDAHLADTERILSEIRY